MNKTGLNKPGLKPGNIDALLGKSNPKKEALITKALKLSEEEIDQVNILSKMLGTPNFSEGLRWCIKNTWSEHGVEATRISKERDSIKPISIFEKR